MKDAVIITISEAGTGGYHFYDRNETVFEDGFPTAWAAAQRVMELYPRYEIYYREYSDTFKRYMMIPGETTEEH